MSEFAGHIDSMTAFCKGRRPDNQCLFGIDLNGNLVCDESAGAHGGSLQGEYLEQIQSPGNSTRQKIEDRVFSR